MAPNKVNESKQAKARRVPAEKCLDWLLASASTRQTKATRPGHFCLPTLENGSNCNRFAYGTECLIVVNTMKLGDFATNWKLKVKLPIR